MTLFDPNEIVSIAKVQLGKNVHTLQSRQKKSDMRGSGYWSLTEIALRSL